MNLIPLLRALVTAFPALTASSLIFLKLPVNTSLISVPAPFTTSIKVFIGVIRNWSIELPTPTTPATIVFKTPVTVDLNSWNLSSVTPTALLTSSKCAASSPTATINKPMPVVAIAFLIPFKPAVAAAVVCLINGNNELTLPATSPKRPSTSSKLPITVLNASS